MDIKPIETFYNGYRFRSRLEARWAVFFDAAGIEYEYEPEGFDLGEYGYYLPDFYLPEFKLYLEIKPFDLTKVKFVGDGNDWEKKCNAFRDTTDFSILLCYGDPAEELYKRLFTYRTYYDDGDYMRIASDEYAMFVSFYTETILITKPEYESFIYDSLKIKNASYHTFMFQFWEKSMWLHTNDYDDPTNRAKLAARQARFEHGEKPSTDLKALADRLKNSGKKIGDGG